MSSRLAARLARREIVRRPGRTALVALLVAVPVASMLIADVMVRTEHGTPLQRWEAQYGRADAVVSGTKLPALPPSRTISWPEPLDTRVARTTDLHRSMLSAWRVDLADPLTRGIYQIRSGRAPTRPGEVFLTRRAAQELGVGVGDTLQLVRPARRSFLVTAVGESAQQWNTTQIVIPPDAPDPWKLAIGFGSAGHLVEFNARPSPAELQRLVAGRAARDGILTFSPALVPTPVDYEVKDVTKKVRWSWVIGALLLTVVGIVIASAFAIGARRQLVTLGQLSGNGAPPRVLQGVLFLQGTLTGVVGAIAGVGLGAAALALLAPHVDRIFDHDVHPYTVRPSDLVPICVLGVVTATIAALVPARTASRVPTLAAMAGRRPLSRVPRWIPVTGALVATGGLALLGLAVLGGRGGDNPNVWLATAIVGGVAVLLGACAIAPFYVSVLEPVASRGRGSWRVATRSLARQRTRTSAVVSAIAATTALTIAGSALLVSAHDHEAHPPFRLASNEVVVYGTGTAAGAAPPSADFAASVERAIRASDRYQLNRASAPNLTWQVGRIKLAHPTDEPNLTLASGDVLTIDAPIRVYSVGVADDTLLDAYRLDAADRDLLARHGALILSTAAGDATISTVTHIARGKVAPPARRIDAPIVDGRHYQLQSLPSVLLTPATATALGATARPSWLVLRAPRSLTTDQRNHIADLATDANDLRGPNSMNGDFYDMYSPPTGIDPLLLEGLLVGVALVLTLFVVAVNLALSASETRDERDVLTVVGASPGVLGRANGYKAALLTVMGAALAIPIGLLPVAVFYAASSEDIRLVLPYAVIGLVVVGVPVAAGLVTALATAVALRVRPVRISTMAFD